MKLEWEARFAGRSYVSATPVGIHVQIVMESRSDGAGGFVDKGWVIHVGNGTVKSGEMDVGLAKLAAEDVYRKVLKQELARVS